MKAATVKFRASRWRKLCYALKARPSPYINLPGEQDVQKSRSKTPARQLIRSWEKRDNGLSRKRTEMRKSGLAFYGTNYGGL
ncbi:hypothetical protein TNIN_30191 [Trichonephila inaurata madagascariensis]|uniref:Uncharacterized protein n=1 Tax=Trichonephila inaurata madagascariensis TaxID=2747483 RepID=A0A8X6YIP9_9ARAC|nr:hypothetical protein TNIN_480791 [Trichonephila inaurata madagascariensis]GFY71458.1 hypothetical protein TNIN_30191 [Trichonephila inaurata madagascariensis]